MLHTPERYVHGLGPPIGWSGWFRAFRTWLRLFLRAYFWEHQEAAVAARRMGLRDRGLGMLRGGCVYPHYSCVGWDHEGPATFCSALLRIGKEKEQDGSTVLWCWRCEEMIWSCDVEALLQSLDEPSHDSDPPQGVYG